MAQIVLEEAESRGLIRPKNKNLTPYDDDYFGA